MNSLYIHLSTFSTFISNGFSMLTLSEKRCEVGDFYGIPNHGMHEEVSKFFSEFPQESWIIYELQVEKIGLICFFTLITSLTCE